MRKRTRFTAPVFPVVLLLAFIPSSGRSQNPHQNTLSIVMLRQTSSKEKVVYVCACLKTKSCSCMTEAKMEGPCACGTEGGPPMKAVSPDSDWAKQNRDELAK
jgi:hypothetical protein